MSSASLLNNMDNVATTVRAQLKAISATVKESVLQEAANHQSVIYWLAKLTSFVFGKLPEKKANTGLVLYKAFTDFSPHPFLGNGHAIIVVHSFHRIPASLNTFHYIMSQVLSVSPLSCLISLLTRILVITPFIV